MIQKTDQSYWLNNYNNKSVIQPYLVNSHLYKSENTSILVNMIQKASQTTD